MKKTKKPKNDYCFAKCTVEPGLFRTEWLVYLNAIDPNEQNRKIKIQLFAGHPSVKDIAGTPRRREPVPALLRVSLLKRFDEVSHVILPQDSQPIGPKVFMDNDDLIQAA